MRYFKLINSSGAMLDITTQQLFFNEVSGLGFDEETSFRHVGEVWWLNTASYRQQVIKGKLLFNCIGGADPYTEYLKFVRFIQKVPLTMLYYPNDLTGKEYRRTVRVTKLEKSEINQYGVIEENIEFTAYTPWYEIREFKNSAGEEYSGAWIWGDGNQHPSVAFPPTPAGKTPTRFGARESRWLSAFLESDTPSPAKLIVYGPVVDPVWTHYVNGSVVATGEFLDRVSIGDNEALVVDNTSEIGQIKVYSAYVDQNGIMRLGSPLRDLYQLRNFNTKCFITLRAGENRITLSSSNTGSIRIQLEGHIYNATV